MAVRVDWERTPVSIHGSKQELTTLLDYLRSKYSVRKHSLIMPDRESDDEAVLFLYQPCDPQWIMEAFDGK